MTSHRDAAEGRVIPPFCFALALLLALLVPSVAAGCAQEQSEICRQYIACQQEYDEAAQVGPTEFADYEADGVCWANAENAGLCDGRCTDALEALRDAAANAGLDAPSCT
jgi:hypothetical protein